MNDEVGVRILNRRTTHRLSPFKTEKANRKYKVLPPTYKTLQCEWVKIQRKWRQALSCKYLAGALSDFPLLNSITYHWSATGFATYTTIVHIVVLETPIVEHPD